MAESTLEPPSGFPYGTTGLEIQYLNHLASALTTRSLYINVQAWASLENSFQISFWEQFATNGCAPAQLQQAVNPVWNKIFQKKFFWCFSFINYIDMYENLDILRWSLSPIARLLQTLALKLSASAAASEFREFRLELMYISLIQSIRSSLTYLHGFQLLVLLP